MAGKVQQLRLGSPATLKLRDPEKESQHQEAEHFMRKDHVQVLRTIISWSRHPRSKEELQREYLEREDFMDAFAQKRQQRFDSWVAFLADQEGRREKLNVVVTREDDPVDDLGTAFMLTRPNAS